MFATMLEILIQRRPVTGPYLRCTACQTVASPAEGLRLVQQHHIRLRAGSVDADSTPPEWTCPGCGRRGPIAQGEEQPADTPVRCRRRWLCRYSWQAPATMTRLTCPRCGADQPGPAAPVTDT